MSSFIGWGLAGLLLLLGLAALLLWLRGRKRTSRDGPASRLGERTSRYDERDGRRSRAPTIWPEGESVLPSLEDYESRLRERKARVDIDLPAAPVAGWASVPAPRPASAPRPAAAAGPSLGQGLPAAAAPAPAPASSRTAPGEPRELGVLALQPASEADWEAAIPLELTGLQLATLSAALTFSAAPARSEYAADVLGLRFPPTAMLRMARAEAAAMRTVGARGGAASPAAAPASLDAHGATAVASTLLAVLAAQRHLEPVRAQWHDVRTALQGLAGGVEQAPRIESLKAAAHELARFVREARDNPAWALATPGLRGRAGQALELATQRWRSLQADADAQRQRGEGVAAAERFGDRELAQALTSVRALRDLRAEIDVAATVLASLHRLRLAFGDATPARAAEALHSIAATLRIGDDRDRAVAERVRAGVGAVRNDFYVGKAALLEQRRELLVGLDALTAQPASAAADFVVSTAAAAQLGFPAADGSDEAWLLRLDPTRRVSAVRRAGR